jgi:hypothetical protein
MKHRLFLLSLIAALALISPAGAEWPADAFNCRAWRADLYWHDWAKRHCRGHRWRYYAQRHRHVPYASGDALCQPIVEATGEQAQTVAAARDSALTAWRGRVRFKYGERFTDFQHARGQREVCAPSSVPDAYRDQKLPPLMRCELSGRPCRVEARALNKEED